MNSLILIITIVFFMLAGYYGAVRSILSELSLDRYMMRYDNTEALVKALYWRRILRLARLTVVAFGVFFAVICLSPVVQQYVPMEPWLYVLTLLVSLSVLWMLSYVGWLKVSRVFPSLFSLTNFPVRLAEWFVTPIYWLVEPMVKENILSPSYRDDAASADDPDFEDHSIEERMFINALDFKDLRIRDCMIPRTEISALNVNDSIEDLRKTFLSSGHSKIIIYRDSVDNILGYCHALALFKKPKEISSIITAILIVPEAMPVRDLMLKFLEERRSLALVVDEFGGTSGLVSVEDVVEQIFGEIQDEYDSTEDWTERQLDEHQYILSARHEIDYLNDKYGWELPEGDYDTLAGMFIDHYGDLPQVNDVLELRPHRFQVVSMQDTRIELIKISVGQVGGKND
ncbi:CBS domain containing-hemolysin-like protein [Dyadobacter jejuensis]|uniref:CBS domain containing-hemolysin-like protein n=1 Tax=Dyadobacter jejuensis TaxID=1082580 RepID=A0A316ABT2_9BACT|nr:hemolysin family protein [Dyadobacter jejuensis]PWJ54490.1 CBS domain containing-hemolysin-like protein [Dyadobacter jejuensis]